MRTTGIYLAGLVASVLLAACSHESTDWKSASTADSTDAYEQFLKAHPSSSHAAAAAARLNGLKEDHDWQAAAAADTRETYEQFVAQHADSKWAQEARIRIENFAQAGSGANAVAGASPAAKPGPSEASAPVAPTAKIRSAPKPAAKAPATSSPRVATSTVKGNAHGEEHHYVQLGAFSSKERAQTQWKELSAKFPSELKSLKPDYVAGTSKQGTVYRLRIAVSSVAAAKGLCGTLKKHSQLCVPGTV